MAEAIRIPRRRGGYTVLSNALLEPGTISSRAYGILVYLVSRPDDWVCQVSDLANTFTEGRDAIYTALKELIRHGYMGLEDYPDPERPGLHRKRYVMLCDNEGKFDPEDISKTAGQPPDSENPDPGFPAPEKPGLTNYRAIQTTEGKNTHSRAARAGQGGRANYRLSNRQADADFDPARNQGLFEVSGQDPPPAKGRTVNPDTGLGLAQHFEQRMRASDDLAAKVGTVNLPALAKSLNGWKKAGVSADQIRTMIDIYVADASLHLKGRVAWVSFLAKRAALAERLQTQEHADQHHNPEADGYAESWGLSHDDVKPFDAPKTWAEIQAERRANGAAH